MDLNALFKLSYGLYVVASNDKNQINGCIVNTVMQITAEPVKCLVVISKQSKTHDMIINSKSFSVSALALSCSTETIAHFGFKSGREVNKFEGINYKLDSFGNPYLEKEAVGMLSCEVFDIIDAETHTLFLANVVDAVTLSPEKPLTYDYYRDHRKGTTPKEAPSYNPQAHATDDGNSEPKYVCKLCHYVYEGEIPFEELPDTYICPVCKKPKSYFQKVES
ncbi:MAG: flavin reductase [Clostridia bacterium]|nr:flavin reductase [Clostridia bacterium]